jgi:hypothetical protein
MPLNKKASSAAIAVAMMVGGVSHAAPQGPPAVSKQKVVRPSPVTPTSDALGRALQDGALSSAQYALQRALSLFHLDEVRARYGDVSAPGPHDATLVLRDLRMQLHRLAGDDRREAENLLERPTDGPDDPFGDGYGTDDVDFRCGRHVCIHWANETRDAPPLADADGNGVPDWVTRTGRVMEQVWRTEVGRFGFRAPKSDTTSENHGPNGKLDVYLVDLGRGFYGYVNSDDPNLDRGSGYEFFDFSSYMVLDDDFSRRQFPPRFTTPGVDGLKVAAAHEFFHSIHLAYDAYEDPWMLEGTATWIEDLVYDGVNDNYNYVNGSPLSHPKVPLDRARRPFVYGSFLFWRLLSETTCRTKPKVAPVRKLWRWADGSRRGPDLYSLAAVKRLRKRSGGSLARTFSRFAFANLLPAYCYEEGGAYRRRARVPLARRYVLGGARAAASSRLSLDHLTSRYIRVQAAGGLGTARLRVTVDLPGRAAGSAAALAWKGKRVATFAPIALNKGGRGARSVSFGAQRRRVWLVLSNGSGRFRCWKRMGFSCQGRPRDDNRAFRFSVRLSPETAVRAGVQANPRVVRFRKTA